MKILQQIYQHPVLTNREMKAVMDSHHKTIVRKGDVLLKVGQTANEYYCLESGVIRSFVIDYDGMEITTNFFEDGDLVIEVVSLFQRTPTKECIQALTDCVCWRISFKDFQQLFHASEGFREWGRGWLTQELLDFKQRSIELVTVSAKERYLSFLRNHAAVAKHAPLKCIASFLGITDTSLSRIRREIARI